MTTGPPNDEQTARRDLRFCGIALSLPVTAAAVFVAGRGSAGGSGRVTDRDSQPVRPDQH